MPPLVVKFIKLWADIWFCIWLRRGAREGKLNDLHASRSFVPVLPFLVALREPVVRQFELGTCKILIVLTSKLAILRCEERRVKKKKNQQMRQMVIFFFCFCVPELLPQTKVANPNQISNRRKFFNPSRNQIFRRVKNRCFELRK